VGSVTVDGWDGKDFLATVLGNQFKAIVNLFRDEEVTVTPTKTSLNLKSPTQGATLRTEPENDSWEGLGDHPSAFAAIVDRDMFLAEIEDAGLFCGGRGVLTVLTGVRVYTKKGGGLGFASSDGVCAIYSGGLGKETVDVEGDGATILSALDLTLGIKLLDKGDIKIDLRSDIDRFTMSDGTNVFYTAGLGGEWPDFARALGKIEETVTVTIPATSLQSVATAASVLRSGSDIELIGRAGEIIVRTVDAGDGAFALRHQGGFTGSRLYDGNALAAATKLADELEFRIPTNEQQATHIVANGRSLFIVPKHRNWEQ
jgi:hypothetical protein